MHAAKTAMSAMHSYDMRAAGSVSPIFISEKIKMLRTCVNNNEILLFGYIFEFLN